MKKILLILTLLISLYGTNAQQEPPWYFINTGVENTHVILVLSSVPITIDGLPIDSGDYIGTFYLFQDTLLCGSGTGQTGDIGGMKYTGETNAVTVWGAEPNVFNGFQEGEIFRWRIWRASDGSVITANAVYDTSVPNIPDSGYFVTNGLSKLASLSATTIPGIDVSINTQSSPVSGCNLSDNEIVTITLQNHDTIPIGNFLVNYTINGQDTVSELFSGSIAPGALQEFTFSQGADLSELGNYTFYAWADAFGDVNYTNDWNKITIKNIAPPDIDLKTDTFFCSGDTLILYPDAYYEDYFWSTGDSSYHTYVWAPGDYILTVTDEVGCKGIDTITVHELQLPTSGLPQSASFCEGEEITLDIIPRFDEITWSNGWRFARQTFVEPGTYSVSLTDFYGCSGTDFIVIEEIPWPTPQLEDTLYIYSTDDSVLLDAGPGFDSYFWSTGDSINPIHIYQPGRYSVSVTDQGCEGSAEIIVQYLDTLAQMDEVYLFPNPVEDMLNIIHHKSEYGKITVYNLIGQEVRSFSYKQKYQVQINFSNFGKGVYLIKIETDKRKFIRQIIKY